MEAMKNMKIEVDKSSTDQALSADSGLRYPYGLTLHLNKDVLKKLDMMKLPEVGSMLGLHALVEVTEVSLEENPNGSRDKSIRLQITDLILKDKSENAEGNSHENKKTILGGGEDY